MPKLDFTYYKDKIQAVTVENIPFYPTKKQALEIYKNLNNNLSSLSEVRQYKPKYAIVYYSMRGWQGGYKLYLSDVEIANPNSAFPDEPTGKFSGKRKAFKINPKDLN